MRRVVDHGAALPTRGGVTTGVVDEMVGSDGSCDEVLNPLAINQTPMKSSHRPPGIAWMLWFCMVCLLRVGNADSVRRGGL